MINQTNRPQLHVSMLDQLARCGVQFQRRYGERFGVWHTEEIIPPSIALAVGSATHKAVEKNLRHKMETGELLELGDVVETARDSCSSICDSGLQLSESESMDIKKTIGTALDQAVALSTLHHAEVAPGLEPLAIEERFVIEMKGHPIDLSGQKDVREVNCIRDTKTSKRSPASDAAHSMQMSMYSLSEIVAGRGLPEFVHLDFLVKLKTPKTVTVSAKPTMEWITPLLRRVERMIEIIDAVKEGKQVFMPASPNDWSCSRRYCGYASTCPYFSGRE